jgi:hypothetical protein
MEYPMKKNVFAALGLRWSRTRDRGATAIVIALCLVVLFGSAAFSFDLANLAWSRQTLRNITDAAAQAGASSLPDTTAAKAAALSYFARSDTSYVPDVYALCMAVSTGGTQPAPGAISLATCDPNPGVTATYSNGVNGVVCDQNFCAIPCNLAGAVCNAIAVHAVKPVPFYFAPAIGIPSGSTGAITSVSCSHSCGGSLNAMDVAIIADRTPSMSDSDFLSMKTGIETTLQSMTPEYQLVTLGTIHRSNALSTDPCKTHLGPVVQPSKSTGYYPDGGARVGRWLPLAQGNTTTGFSNSYLTGTLGSTGRTLPLTSGLGYQVDCMDHFDKTDMMDPKTNQSNYPWGTHLAAPLKSAARLLLGKDPSNLSTLSAQRATLLKAGSKIKQWIILETDGQPDETMGYNSKPYKDATGTSNNVDLTSALEPSSPGAGSSQACTNLINVAAAAKTANIGIITIFYQGSSGSIPNCGSKNVAQVLAATASPADNGSASTAPSDCASANTDNDYYFCASDGTQLAKIFSTALKAAESADTRFVQMPGS